MTKYNEIYDKYYKKLIQKLQIWQKIVTNVGATNEQTNENKTNKATNYYMILTIII